jgi:branched-subunit amino acid transport protein
MSLGLTILAAGAVTYATRLGFIAAHGRVAMPPWFVRALGFVPVAVLSALIAPEVLPPCGGAPCAAVAPRLVAGAVSAFLAWRTRSVGLTIAAGMATLWGLQWAMGGFPP